MEQIARLEADPAEVRVVIETRHGRQRLSGFIERELIAAAKKPRVLFEHCAGPVGAVTDEMPDRRLDGLRDVVQHALGDTRCMHPIHGSLPVGELPLTGSSCRALAWRVNHVK